MNNFDDLLNNSPDAGAPQLSKEEYAAKKKADRDIVFALSDQTSMEVATDGGKFRSFLDLQTRLDRYSAVNALLTFAQNPNASRLGDFDYWKRNNCSVKPGQTAISILEPHEYTKEDNTPGTGYNVKKVFDISQVDTRKLRTASPPKYTERQLLGALTSKAPVQIIGVDELPDDRGAMSNPDGIFVRKGMEFSDTFRAVAQELALVELAAGEINQADSYFSAYSASYLLCKKYGVDTKDFRFESANRVFDGMDAQGIKAELSQIRDAAENISSRMSRQLESLQKSAKSQDAR